MEREQVSSCMKIRRAALIVVAGIITASCSEKSAPDRKKHSSTPEATREPGSQVAEGEGELQPREDEIEENCVAFVRSTKVVPAQAPTAGCPACPAQGAEVLTFRQMKTDRISCSGDTCTVAVTIRVSFNAGAGERIAGGLTAWISPEQRSAYLSGRTPTGEQAYRVQITYKRRGEAWRAVEFDRAPIE
jgi:Ni,Fe-hydrogenase III small subunit